MAEEIERVVAYMPMSVEARDDYCLGFAEAVQAVLDGTAPPREPRPVPPTPRGYTALLEVTTGALRAVVELHAPDWYLGAYYVCRGCDADGYEWEPPQWPCGTVALVADQVGVELREGEHG